MIKCIRDACLHHHICPLVKWLSPEKFPRTPFKSQQQQQCQEFSINQKNESWNTFLHTFTLENSPKNSKKQFQVFLDNITVVKNHRKYLTWIFNLLIIIFGIFSKIKYFSGKNWNMRLFIAIFEPCAEINQINVGFWRLSSLSYYTILAIKWNLIRTTRIF